MILALAFLVLEVFLPRWLEVFQQQAFQENAHRWGCERFHAVQARVVVFPVPVP